MANIEPIQVEIEVVSVNVSTLSLRPGDVLVLHLPLVMEYESSEIAKYIRGTVPEGVKVAVLPHGCNLTVLRKETSGTLTPERKSLQALLTNLRMRTVSGTSPEEQDKARRWATALEAMLEGGAS